MVATVAIVASETFAMMIFYKTSKFTIKNTNAVIDKSETDQNCIKMELT